MSGPDSGLALAIGLAMVCMVAGPGLIGAGVGFAIARGTARGAKEKATPRTLATIALTVGGFVVGVGAGAIAIVFTFFESTFDPELVFETPPGFSQPEVWLLEDPSASAEIDWDTFRLEGRIEVPASGVVRLRSLSDIEGQSVNATLSTGETNNGYRSAPTPPGLPGAWLVCFGFRPWTPGEETCEREGTALVEHIEALERGL